MEAETKTMPPILDGLIGDDAVAALVGYSKKQIPKLIEAGFLPPPITLGSGERRPSSETYPPWPRATAPSALRRVPASAERLRHHPPSPSPA